MQPRPHDDARTACPHHPRARLLENSTAGSGSRPRTRSDAFSPIMIVGAFVLDETIFGITEASQTRKFAIPRTRRSGVTTASAS